MDSFTDPRIRWRGDLLYKKSILPIYIAKVQAGVDEEEGEGSEKSPSQTSDSEETEYNKKRHKFISRKYFQLWRHNVHAAKRKVALRKVSSMMEKLMRQKNLARCGGHDR